MAPNTKEHLKIVHSVLQEYYKYFLNDIVLERAYGNKNCNEVKYAIECTISTLKGFKRYALKDGIKNPTIYQSVMNYLVHHKYRYTYPKFKMLNVI